MDDASGSSNGGRLVTVRPLDGPDGAAVHSPEGREGGAMRAALCREVVPARLFERQCALAAALLGYGGVEVAPVILDREAPRLLPAARAVGYLRGLEEGAGA